MGIKNKAIETLLWIGLGLTSACSMPLGSTSGVVSDSQSFCANRDYVGDDGYIAQHPADASTVHSYDHYFCGTIQLHQQDNSVSIRFDQIVRDYGGGGVSVLARTADMDELVEVQYISPATMDDAVYSLENGESVEIKNISGGSVNVEDYVEWALAVRVNNRWVILNQDSYFVACNDTEQRCSNMSRQLKIKSWVEAATYLRF